MFEEEEIFNFKKDIAYKRIIREYNHWWILIFVRILGEMFEEEEIFNLEKDL